MNSLISSEKYNQVDHDSQDGRGEEGGSSKVGNIILSCIIQRRSPVGVAVSSDIMTIRGTKERKRKKEEEDDDAVEKRSAQGNAPYHPSIHPSHPKDDVDRPRSPPHVLRENHEGGRSRCRKANDSAQYVAASSSERD